MTELLLVVLGAAIAKLTEMAFDAYKRRALERATPTLARLDDVLKWGWTGSDLLTHLIAFDRKVIGDELNEQREGTVPQWAPVFTAHPETWVLLTKGPKHIVGYWHFAALKDDQFRRAKTGDLQDSEITLDTIDPIDVPGIYNLYFTLLGRLPDCPGGGGILIESFYNQIEALTTRGVFFREICANAMTKDGARICEGLGMTQLCAHKDFGTVYWLSMQPWPARLRHKRWSEVAEAYDSALNMQITQQTNALYSSPVSQVLKR
jgi:hypothetical protein